MSEGSVRRIVVADDEADIAMLLTFNLEAAGYEVTAVGDGAAALAAIREIRPDLAVLDVMMPELTGLEVLAAVRADEELRDIPVVMLTARAGDADVWEGWQAGVDYYITKPFDLEELMRFIDYLQANRQLTR
jgi:DNA-binding response OmpR family regulator